MSDCDNCTTFSIAGESCTVYLNMPSYNSEDNKITKNIDRKTFWSENYEIDDKGINTQSLVLSGVEPICETEKRQGICFSHCVLDCGARFPLCFAEGSPKFRFIGELSDAHEKITISGLGDCMDAVYIIRRFNYRTFGPKAYAWTMVLEKVRD